MSSSAIEEILTKETKDGIKNSSTTASVSLGQLFSIDNLLKISSCSSSSNTMTKSTSCNSEQYNDGIKSRGISTHGDNIMIDQVNINDKSSDDDEDVIDGDRDNENINNDVTVNNNKNLRHRFQRNGKQNLRQFNYLVYAYLCNLMNCCT